MHADLMSHNSLDIYRFGLGTEKAKISGLTKIIVIQLFFKYMKTD